MSILYYDVLRCIADQYMYCTCTVQYNVQCSMNNVQYKVQKMYNSSIKEMKKLCLPSTPEHVRTPAPHLHTYMMYVIACALVLSRFTFSTPSLFLSDLNVQKGFEIQIVRKVLC